MLPNKVFSGTIILLAQNMQETLQACAFSVNMLRIETSPVGKLVKHHIFIINHLIDQLKAGAFFQPQFPTKVHNFLQEQLLCRIIFFNCIFFNIYFQEILCS